MFEVVVIAYSDEWSAMVKDARQGHEAMLRSYEDQCKAKKVSLYFSHVYVVVLNLSWFKIFKTVFLIVIYHLKQREIKSN